MSRTAARKAIELAHERELAGRAGSRRVIKDRLGRIVEDDWLREPVDGRDLALSHRQPGPVHRLFGAEGRDREAPGEGGRRDRARCEDGEVLALANWPSYDPNARGAPLGRRDPQSRAHRHVRAGLDDEAVLGGGGA